MGKVHKAEDPLQGGLVQPGFSVCSSSYEYKRRDGTRKGWRILNVTNDVTAVTCKLCLRIVNKDPLADALKERFG